MYKWDFPNNNNGEIVGINEAGIETFKGSLFSSLAREICQNSLDARSDYTKPVKIEFMLSSENRYNICQIDELSKALYLCKKYWLNNRKAVNFFDNAFNKCNQEKIRVLRISDFNTTGLTGSNQINCSPWQDLVKSAGVSNKTGESGGSFGIGKSAPFACSELRTIFYNTLDINGLSAFQGVAKIVTFKKDDGSSTQGKGYYGESIDNTAIRTPMSFCGYQRDKVGTDVFIIGFIEHTEWENEIIKAVIEGYLISILQNDLEVKINNTIINRTTIKDLCLKYKTELPLTYNYFEVLTNDKTICIEENFEQLGTLELKILLSKDFKRKVLMARNNGMKILDKANISSAIQFAGVCIFKGSDLNQYFRKMENPQHNNWESDRFSDNEQENKEAEKIKRKLFRFIKEKVLEIGKTTVLDEIDAIGVGDFMPDIVNEKESSKNKIEDISNKVKNYTKIIKKNSIKVDQLQTNKKNNSTIAEFIKQSLNPLEDFEYGGLQEDSNNEKTQKNNHSENNNKKGQENKKVEINPYKLRLFMCDKKINKYKLLFKANKSLKDVTINMYFLGEQGNAKINIQQAILNSKVSLKFKQNKIMLPNIVEGEDYIIYFVIKENEVYSMGVYINGFKI